MEVSDSTVKSCNSNVSLDNSLEKKIGVDQPILDIDKNITSNFKTSGCASLEIKIEKAPS